RWPIRLGRPETEVAEHLRWLNGPFAEQLRAGCEAGIDLVELADQALQLAALPGRWFSRRCGAPRGALEPGLSG
ncbi:oxamate carbamoyltransferase subunit AllG family protein, partial [Bordetella pertussis]|uniref:oxamate carbamoyltransferase subunit AllG family protein n=1 Tax=Bordetella pertussis TaxID=520 RepID=UPI0010712CEF